MRWSLSPASVKSFEAVVTTDPSASSIRVLAGRQKQCKLTLLNIHSCFFLTECFKDHLSQELGVRWCSEWLHWFQVYLFLWWWLCHWGSFDLHHNRPPGRCPARSLEAFQPRWTRSSGGSSECGNSADLKWIWDIIFWRTKIKYFQTKNWKSFYLFLFFRCLVCNCVFNIL